jgi:hypothetical protein
MSADEMSADEVKAEGCGAIEPRVSSSVLSQEVTP